jgi:hypothetical protein
MDRKTVTQEFVHRMMAGDDLERVRWIDDGLVYARLNDVPIMITIELDERYEALLSMEQQAHNLSDKLRSMNFHRTAAEADTLANYIAQLELEL